MERKINNKIYYLMPFSVLVIALMYYLIDASLNKSKTAENNTDVSVPSSSQTLPDESSRSEINQDYSNSNSSSTTVDNSKNSTNTSVVSKINISNRCRGCGRCAQIDPEHFEVSGRYASVISNSNLNSSKLQNAISACPENAISLQ